jgi:general secretion pathway protein L
VQTGAVIHLTGQTCQAWVSGAFYEGLIEHLPAFHGELVVLISSTQICLTHTTIPARTFQQLQQALPYSLEERLVDHVDNLHFAIGKRDKNGATVAILTHALMQQTIETLSNAKLQPAIVMPDVLAVPYPMDGWGILCLNNIALVRTGLQSGFAIEINLLPNLLEMLLEETKNKPVIWLYQHPEEKHHINFPNIIEKNYSDPPLEWLANNIEKNCIINLLQGKYRPQSPFQQYIRPLILTASLVGFLVIIYFISLFQQLHELRQTSNELSQKIETLYKDTFPQSKKIINPRAQMASKLAEQTTLSNQKEPFLETLLQLHKVLPETGFSIKKITLKNKEFSLTLEINDPQLLANLQSQLPSQDWDIQINGQMGNFRTKLK